MNTVLPSRQLGTSTAIAVVVASMIGTGVFTTTGFLVQELGSPLAVLAVWAVGGLLALCGALSYAEIAAALPQNGGEYRMLARIYHPSVGFVAGVISLVVGFAAPLAASALAFGHYASAVSPSVPPLAAALTVVVVAALGHGLDVRWGAAAQHFMTFGQVAVIAAIIVLGVAYGDPALVLEHRDPVAKALVSPAFAVSLVFVSFAYSGWNGAVYIAGEVRDPSRTMPLALVTGTVLVSVLYVGLNLAFLTAVPVRELAGVVEVASTAAVRLVGPAGGRGISAVIALALASSVSALLLTGSRVYEAIGRDHGVFAPLARRTQGGAPVVAVVGQALLAVGMILTASFGWLLAFIGFTLSISATLTVAGVFVLRAREPGLARPYRAWGYPVTPLLFIGLSLWMALHSLLERPASSLAGLAVIVGSLLLYAFVARSARRGRCGPDSKEKPCSAE